MNRFAIILVFCPLMTIGQISFLRNYVTDAGAHLVSRPYEMTNGNFICSVLHRKNNQWENILYVFSPCGEPVATLRTNAPDEYAFVTNFFQIDSISLLATGFGTTPYSSTYFILDPSTLDVLQSRRYEESALNTIIYTSTAGDLLWQHGHAGSRVVTSRLNTSLVRNLHLALVFEEFEYPDLFYFSPFAGENMTCSHEVYRDAQSHIYDRLRCFDPKLRGLFLIDGYGDSIGTTFRLPIPLGGDTLLTGAIEHERYGTGHHRFVHQYVRDTLIYTRPVGETHNFFDYTFCHELNGILRCIRYDGKIAEFTTQGELLFTTDHLIPLLNEGDMSRAIVTRDNGYFSVSARYVQIDGVWREVLRIVKTTADYQISDTPHPQCISATSEPDPIPQVHIFPNPTQGEVRVSSDTPVIAYRVVNTISTCLLSGQVNARQFDLSIAAPPGVYFLQLQTRHGWVSHKLVVLSR